MIVDGRSAAIDLSYLVATVLFVVGLKQMSSPASARRGNQLAAIGMAVAIVATLFEPDLQNLPLILVGIAVGAVASGWVAQRVQMTQMPQMVAIFNGMGGATAALVSVVEFEHTADIGRGEAVSIVLGTIIGAISFTGSIVAFAKLQELISGRPIVLPSRQIVNAAFGAAVVVLAVLVVALGDAGLARGLLVVLFAAALALGALLVLPIGGADMPVVIAILNSLTGLAAALTGLVLGNQALVVAGVLVGASGSLLTLLMARAMNRSVSNVLFGAFGAAPAATAGGGAAGEALPVREMSVEDAAVPLAYAERVVIVPGYGLAVAQAQHAARELADVLGERGVDVRYAIHPVAGRMPGHMNELLAEANVPYDDLYEMDDINGDFARTSVALVVGANDVTNPAARSNPDSPIYGMPILNVDQAQQVIVLKRSMKSGFAGIENELFHMENTSMVFGDAKDSLSKLVAAVKVA
ncbi:MAG: NAD(P)(+) transhydrogenase (Re/Si-specific) subunit beta [Chloroflexia bacterium]|nr:NAD(P)(+) transhydrogenase (Re/Si-specific) subunit beta [Chloroflexia bacterium]